MYICTVIVERKECGFNAISLCNTHHYHCMNGMPHSHKHTQMWEWQKAEPKLKPLSLSSYNNNYTTNCV